MVRTGQSGGAERGIPSREPCSSPRGDAAEPMSCSPRRSRSRCCATASARSGPGATAARTATVRRWSASASTSTASAARLRAVPPAAPRAAPSAAELGALARARAGRALAAARCLTPRDYAPRRRGPGALHRSRSTGRARRSSPTSPTSPTTPSSATTSSSDWRLTRDGLLRPRRRRALPLDAPLHRFAWGDMTFVEVEPPHRIVAVGRGGKFNRIKTYASWTLEPAPGGGTRVEYMVETEPALPTDRLDRGGVRPARLVQAQGAARRCGACGRSSRRARIAARARPSPGS